MKQMHIPTIGDEVTLAAAWTFTVYNEHRNETLIDWMGKRVDDQYSHPLGEVMDARGVRDWTASNALTTTCTLPKGTLLRIDRIYIRKNMAEFDSVTFFLKGAKTAQQKVDRTFRRVTVKPGLNPFRTPPEAFETVDIPYTETKPARAVRFWAKLADVNTMKIK